MVNLTQKIKTLALQNNIPYQDCTAKLTEYFVFNNWFNDLFICGGIFQVFFL